MSFSQLTVFKDAGFSWDHETHFFPDINESTKQVVSERVLLKIVQHVIWFYVKVWEWESYCWNNFKKFCVKTLQKNLEEGDMVAKQ